MKYAIAGAGYIASIHAQAILNQGGQVTTLIGRNSERSAAFCQKYDVGKRCETVEEALQRPNFDALVVATPNYLHAPQTIAALKAGIAVMVEKPMAMNAAEAARMLAASQATKAALMVAHCWRFDSEVLWLKAQVEKLGKIIRTRGLGVHTHWGPSGWFTQKNLAGGGALADMGIHAIDTTRFLLGDPLPASVYARVGTHYKGGEVDDTGVLLIEWQNGAVSYIESGWWQPHSDGIESAAQLYGRQGFGSLFPTFLKHIDPAAEEMAVEDPGFAFPRRDHAPQEIYDRQIAHFIGAIRQGVEPVPGGEEGWINMRIVDAAYESSRIGQVVDLHPPAP
jgi:predicted dehydrogenase